MGTYQDDSKVYLIMEHSMSHKGVFKNKNRQQFQDLKSFQNNYSRISTYYTILKPAIIVKSDSAVLIKSGTCTHCKISSLF